MSTRSSMPVVSYILRSLNSPAIVTGALGNGLCVLTISVADGSVHVKASCSGMIMRHGIPSLTKGKCCEIDASVFFPSTFSSDSRNSVFDSLVASSTYGPILMPSLIGPF